ncbi:Cysteine-rich repeat secretory protein 3 [Senna tora]|uniref:Cysteine-rich repeat secretory protein 3 n=1 Tax=Senna tora TaxID=362788 RepID=A0A835CDC5_9FABA|nr:Cysteine-rich repeat secretory protein 3 [Senna tora]
MGFPRKKPLFLLVFLIFFQPQLPQCSSSSDYTTLVYKGCSKETFTDPNGFYSQSLSALFGSLVSQSTKAKFYKATAGNGQTAITGLFQCRGDLSNSDCYNCVSRLPVLSNKLCGKTVAARVQLLGCYMLYEVSGFAQISGMQMLYKTCGASNVAGSGFEERRDTAFSVMENGVVSNHGFYTTSYQSMYVLGQCEGDIGDSDCGECVKNAVQRGQNTGKTVAIILGGAAGVAFLVICLLFARNLMKKHDGILLTVEDAGFLRNLNSFMLCILSTYSVLGVEEMEILWWREDHVEGRVQYFNSMWGLLLLLLLIPLWLGKILLGTAV